MSHPCAGESSAGKTQTCMQLLMTAQWPAAEGGLDGDALCAPPRYLSFSLRSAELCLVYSSNYADLYQSRMLLLTLAAGIFTLKVDRLWPGFTKWRPDVGRGAASLPRTVMLAC